MSSKSNQSSNLSPNSFSESILTSSSWVEDALYGESPLLRDQARSHILRTASRSDVKDLVNAVSSPTRHVRRRATRLLAEMQPHRVHSLLVDYLHRPRTHHILQASSEKDRRHATDEGVLCIARILTTLASEFEPHLVLIFKDKKAKVRRASITPALPLEYLEKALLDEDRGVVEKACTLWFKTTKVPAVSAVEKALDQHSDLDILYRLYARVAPRSPRLIKDALRGQKIAIQSIADLPTLLSLFDQYPQEVAWTCVHHRLHHLIDHPLYFKKMITHTLPQVRMALTRLLPAEHEGLNQLAEDQDSGVAWMANLAQKKGFHPQLLEKRLGPHDRLALPSAQPPYGLRPHDELPKIHRIKAALALCHTRFNVNVGVAMRSAEAAGLEALYLMGESSLSTSPTRGAELAIPLHHAPDPLSLLMMARQAGYQIVAVQQTPDSQPYHQAVYPPNPLFVLGSEDSGLPDLLREAADLVVEIPLYGLIDSLNVATAATCVVMHWRNHLDPPS